MMSFLSRARSFAAAHPRTAILLGVGLLALLLVMGAFGDTTPFVYNAS